MYRVEYEWTNDVMCGIWQKHFGLETTLEEAVHHVNTRAELKTLTYRNFKISECITTMKEREEVIVVREPVTEWVVI